MARRREFIAGLVAAGLVSAAYAGGMPTLAEAAAAKGLFFGSAVTSAELKAGDAYTDLLRQQCAVWTPEWELKWDPIEAIEGVRNYAAADYIAATARNLGKRVRGHALLWHRQLPGWAKSLSTPADWDEHVVPYLIETVGRFGPEVFQWDVVNEAIQPEDGEPGGLRNNLFYRLRGPDYLAEAFAIAHANAPAAKLYLNDYDIYYAEHFQQRRRDALLGLIEGLVGKGVPLHGLGVQGHLDIRRRFDEGVFAKFLDDVAAAGLEITITELDVTEGIDNPAPLPARFARAAEEVRKVLEVALDRPAVRGVVAWSLSDKASWLRIDRGIPDNHGLPYDEALRPTPMRDTLIEVFKNAPDRLA